jgi:hypothetical protein
MPCEASSAIAPVVSSIEIPIWCATGPTYLSAPAMSVTSPCALPAAAASRSAMCGMSLPEAELVHRRGGDLGR